MKNKDAVLNLVLMFTIILVATFLSLAFYVPQLEDVERISYYLIGFSLIFLICLIVSNRYRHREKSKEERGDASWFIR